MFKSTSEMTINGIKPIRKRRKSLPMKNHFRGVKKDELQKQTSKYLASMTVICAENLKIIFKQLFPD